MHYAPQIGTPNFPAQPRVKPRPEQWEPLGITSPMLCGAPSGVMAHSVYVRYSRPKRVGGDRCATLTSISVRPRFDSTVASPLASGMRTVPRKSITVGPDRSEERRVGEGGRTARA